MKKIAIVLGTRPEAIKLIPVYLALVKSTKFEPVLISTGQHKEMLAPIFDFFEVHPEISLDVMVKNQSLSKLTGNLFSSLEMKIDFSAYWAVIVQGDTTTAMVVSMVSFYNKIQVIHVEAGLRTFNKYSPFPEDTNRRIIGLVADFHFAPTEESKEILIKEKANNVYMVGNTVIDSLLLALNRVRQDENKYFDKFKSIYNPEKPLILITGHRRENFGSGFQNICSAIGYLAKKYESIQFIYPLHLNPNVKDVVSKSLGKVNNIKLIDPLPYDEIIFLMSRSKLILTDSGGIQEEAPSLGVPLIVMRDTTERPEGIEAGCAVLAGTSRQRIIDEFEKIYEDEILYKQMSQTKNPYGNGTASKQILVHLKEFSKG